MLTTLESLSRRVSELEAALLNTAGDNLCWLDSLNPSADPLVTKIPPWPEFAESCRRFHAQISGESGVLEGCRTITQLEAENAEMTRALVALAGRICGSQCSERYPDVSVRCGRCLAIDVLTRLGKL